MRLLGIVGVDDTWSAFWATAREEAYREGTVLNATTVPDDRPISAEEAALVRWLLLNASMGGDWSDLAGSVDDLRVVGRCSCGCPSIDFIADGQSSGAFPVASGYGTSADGVVMGVIVWERGGVVSGLEFCEFDDPVRALPLADTLTMMAPF